ncbi:sensor histidine kinase [Agrobacterium tumefaciens]|uniref:sensor histidine kinase n=1 Tax=Agrobacterium tumefaciens TaxID=358 RepID=UPI000976769C|nr:RstB [Agrobacterium tumefaciens]
MFKISARTVLELGSELISSDIIAFYELIKNGFDAQSEDGVDIALNIVLRRNAYLALHKRLAAACDALKIDPLASVAPVEDFSREIVAKLNSDAGSLGEQYRSLLAKATDHQSLLEIFADAQSRLNTITVSDQGTGMSLEDLTKTFLVIGTPSRKKEVDAAFERGEEKAPYLGEKGIGRLSAMRLGNRLRVETARAEDEHMNLVDIDWNRFADLDAMLDEIDVSPEMGGPKPEPSWSGTRIIIGDLGEDWTKDRITAMAEYDFARLTDPFIDPKERPRIGIRWNDDRTAIPWMNRRLIESAHASLKGSYSFVGGKPSLSVEFEARDLGYPHPVERQTIQLPLEDLESAIVGTSKSVDDSALWTVGPFQFEAFWYNRRRLGGIEGIGEQRVVKELQERWSGILLFRDRFRVFPYGEDEDDWLGLDRKALRRSGYVLNKTQFVGRVEISRTANPALVDQTNREGLRETPEQHVLLEVMRHVIQDLLWRFMRDVDLQYKQQKIDLSDARVKVDNLETRAKSALRRIRQLAPPEAQDTVEDLQQTLHEFSEFAAQARIRIEQVEQEGRQMIDMAGVGLMVEVVAHELARASENALAALDDLAGQSFPREVASQLSTLKAEMKSISKRVRILDPLSVSGRQRTEIFDLNLLIRETFEAHEAQFRRQRITLETDLSEKPIRVRAVKGMIVQIIENLISNSVYWLEMRQEREASFKAIIKVSVETGPPTILYEDNGRGIAPENRDNVFKPFFSLKEKSKRRGLGLFIARESAEHHDGKLILDDAINPETGRLHRFLLELPEKASI